MKGSNQPRPSGGRKSGTRAVAPASPGALPSTSELDHSLEQAEANDGRSASLSEMYRVAVENAPAGILLMDSRGVIQLVNSAAERMFAYTREELVGRNFDELLVGRFRFGGTGLRNSFIGGPSSGLTGAVGHLTARRKDGSEVPIEASLEPVGDRDGEHMVIAVIVDITLKLKQQEEIAERTEELRRSNQELEQFAYIASHDLQEPLRTVVNFTELFSERYGDKLDDRGERYVRHIVEGSKRMQALVRALLTYSRVSSQGKEPVAVDSQAILKSVCDSMHVTIQATGAEITWRELPAVLADEVQLAQVFQNLIGNAIKFCGRGRPTIQISARRRKDGWVFAVQDNGIGIEKEHAGRLFQMFQRLHPRGTYEGSGIGLALSKRIVERHGGQIWFESEPGKGSTFYFNLKATEKERTDD